MTANAKEAAVTEAVPAPLDEKGRDMVTVTYAGNDYTFDRNRIREDIDLLEAFETGQMVTPIKMILGPRQWVKFREDKPGQSELGELADLIFEALGVNLGE